MIKKIIKLSQVFIKEYFKNLEIFNKNQEKNNVKTTYKLLLIIIMIIIGFFSLKIIDYLNKIGQEGLFLKIYFPILANIFMFQAILVCCNVFFFSKDLEYILPIPIKPIELLVSKFNTVITITYFMEGIVLFVPLVIYGIIGLKTISYYFIMLIVLIIFPMFFIISISTIMLFVMQLTKIIKNKEIFQILVVMILTFILTSANIYFFKTTFNTDIINLENVNKGEIIINQIDKFNNYYIGINSCISILDNLKISNVFIELIKLILINFISFLIFLVFGKKIYLKNLLKNIAYINNKKNIKKEIKNKYKKNTKKKSYIKNELKKIIKNPTFFNQCIFKYIFIVIILAVIINFLFPMLLENFKTEDYIRELGINNFILQCICLVIGIVQIIFTLNNISITAISRDGITARVMKYIPVPLYKQFLWKNIPHIFLNMFTIIVITGVISINIENIPIIYYILGIIIAILLNFINSFCMLIVNLKKPNLDCLTDISALSDNKNMLYQYIETIIVVLMLMYFTKVLGNINILISLFIIIAFFSITFMLIIFYIKKNINKLFKKIY